MRKHPDLTERENDDATYFEGLILQANHEKAAHQRAIDGLEHAIGVYGRALSRLRKR